MDPNDSDDEYETVHDDEIEVIEYVYEETRTDFTGIDFVPEG